MLSDGIFQLSALNPFGKFRRSRRKRHAEKMHSSSPFSSVVSINLGCPSPTDNMTSKCVHKGCGKEFTDPEEACVYHPGPPVFHEGQKGKDLDSSV